MEEKCRHILSVAVPKPIEGLFTYLVPVPLVDRIQIGGWVRVPFRKKLIHAFVVEPVKRLEEISPAIKASKLLEIAEVGEGGCVIPDDVLALCKWAHEYYRAPLGEVIHCAVPPAALGLRNAKRKPRPLSEVSGAAIKFDLTAEQAEALAAIEILRTSPAGPAPKVALLQGVTGSGKTELYLELARRTLQQGRGVLLLVPEIALTPQLHRRFEEGLGVRVGLWHSAMADGVRRDQGAALRGGSLRVVVGARSSIFAPISDLGLIVVDEEHDSSYKQEDRVKYNARDLAVVRAKFTGALAVLGSATPSLESLERVREGRYVQASLTKRIAHGGLPEIQVIDLCEEPKVEGIQAPLAEKTLAAIRETLAAGTQAMVFLNRRGFAAFLVCRDCGDVQGCHRCSISLTLHKRRGALVCHVCGYLAPIPDFCPKCQGAHLLPMGAGTESLEEDLPKLIPSVRAIRLDRDQVTSATRLSEVLDEFRDGKANLLLGTQMLVKGHDFPQVTLVVVILADALFRWPDFRAPERALQILTQVSGRAGRGERPGRVLIQTFQPNHPVIEVVAGRAGLSEFLAGERDLRKALGYPPFGRLARLRFEDESSAKAKMMADRIAQLLSRLETQSAIDLLGPSEAFLEKAKGIYRWDLLIKAGEVFALHQAVMRAQEACRQEKWPVSIDVDPYGVG